MLLIFTHISIGSLVVWLVGMPLSECDHHWTHLNALEHAWTCLSGHEHLWESIECAWTRLNALWVHVNDFEWALNVVEHGWMRSEVSIERGWTRLSACKHLWVSLNATECTQLLIPIWKWVCMDAFEQVWQRLNALECTLSAHECIWASNECDWMHLNAL